MPMTPPDDRLHYLPLYREQFVIVLHPRHRLAASTSVRVRDLCGERYLSRINCEFDQAATRIFETCLYAEGLAAAERFHSRGVAPDPHRRVP